MREILFRGFYDTPNGEKTIYVDGVKSETIEKEAGK